MSYLHKMYLQVEQRRSSWFNIREGVRPAEPHKVMLPPPKWANKVCNQAVSAAVLNMTHCPALQLTDCLGCLLWCGGVAADSPGAPGCGSAFSPRCVCWAPPSLCPPHMGFLPLSLFLPWTWIADICTLHPHLKELGCLMGCCQELTLSPLWHCTGKPVKKPANNNCFLSAVFAQLTSDFFFFLIWNYILKITF